MRSYRAWKRRPSDCLAAAHSRFWRRRTLTWDPRPRGGVGPGGPGHVLARSSFPGVTEVGVLPTSHLVDDEWYYDPVGLPLRSARFHHWLIRAVFADKPEQTGLSCSE